MASRLKSGQREKLRNFMLVTNAAEPTALHCLRATEFNLELAIDQYYSQGVRLFLFVFHTFCAIV